MSIKTGDNVKVCRGRDRGKSGKVIQVLKNKATRQVYVVVEGLNIRKKHLRTSKEGEKGQIVELSAPIHASNVVLAEKKSEKKKGTAEKKSKEALKETNE